MTISTAAARMTALGTQTNNPIVAWDNKAAGAGVTYGGTATLTGGAAANAFDGDTVDYWLPNVTTTQAALVVIFPTAVEITFAAIAAHNLANFGGSVTLSYSTTSGASWVNAGAGTVTPTDNSPIGFRAASGVSATYWRFLFTGLTAGNALAVGAAFMGPETVLPQRIYDGFQPVITPTEVDLQPNVTVGGNFVAQSTITQGSTLKAEFNYMPPAFVRGEWKGFQAAFNKGTPFFFAWRPATFPDDLHFCQRAGEAMRPTNAGGLDYMSATMQARVYEVTT